MFRWALYYQIKKSGGGLLAPRYFLKKKKGWTGELAADFLFARARKAFAPSPPLLPEVSRSPQSSPDHNELIHLSPKPIMPDLQVCFIYDV